MRFVYFVDEQMQIV